MEQLKRCLDRALNDVDMGDTGFAGQAALKRDCVFASRPGVALIVAAYADKHWSSQWDVVMVLLAATTDGKKAIGGAFWDIPIGRPEKPTLFIATVDSCGTCLDSLPCAQAQARLAQCACGRGRQAMAKEPAAVPAILAVYVLPHDH